MKILLNNKKAFFEYEIISEIEAGIVLQGSEVKSLRDGKASLVDSFVAIKQGEIFIHNFNINLYEKSTSYQPNQNRVKKLLLKKSEINKLLGKVKKDGFTIVPLKIYLNQKNLIKVLIALVKGKKQHDKRKTIKEREWNRDKHKILKLNNQ